MNRKERTRILVEGSRKVLSRMACEAEQLYAVAMVREPTEELVMLKVREGAQCSLFYLGEAAPMATVWCWERTARKPVIWRLSMRCMP